MTLTVDDAIPPDLLEAAAGAIGATAASVVDLSGGWRSVVTALDA
jgi:hypothetical protein